MRERERDFSLQKVSERTVDALAVKYFRVNGSNSYLGGWIIVNTPHSLSWGRSSAWPVGDNWPFSV